MPGQAAHRALLAQEPFEVLRFEGGTEDFHRDRAVEFLLPAAVDDSETTAADLLGICESGRLQIANGSVLVVGDVEDRCSLRLERILFHHRCKPPRRPVSPG